MVYAVMPDDSQAMEDMPVCPDCSDEVKVLEQRTYKTYMARLQACNRLQYRARAWNALVISASLAGLIASAAMVRDSGVYGENGDLLWLMVAIATFAGSLITASLNYSGRSRDMFLSYRKIQALSGQFEMLKRHNTRHQHGRVAALKGVYDSLLDESENHTPADYFRTIERQLRTSRQQATILWSKVLDLLPWFSVALPVILLIPPVRIFLP